MGAVFGTRVTPMMNLSVEDVRGYLAVQLDRLNNKRLKIGDVKADDGNITADIVTLDNSLVQRLKVDRHTGAIDTIFMHGTRGLESLKLPDDRVTPHSGSNSHSSVSPS
jgi:hypothetical protein